MQLPSFNASPAPLPKNRSNSDIVSCLKKGGDYTTSFRVSSTPTPFLQPVNLILNVPRPHSHPLKKPHRNNKYSYHSNRQTQRFSVLKRRKNVVCNNAFPPGGPHTLNPLSYACRLQAQAAMSPFRPLPSQSDPSVSTRDVPFATPIVPTHLPLVTASVAISIVFLTSQHPLSLKKSPPDFYPDAPPIKISGGERESRSSILPLQKPKKKQKGAFFFLPIFFTHKAQNNL
jgi:hypothetical protein